MALFKMQYEAGEDAGNGFEPTCQFHSEVAAFTYAAAQTRATGVDWSVRKLGSREISTFRASDAGHPAPAKATPEKPKLPTIQIVEHENGSMWTVLGTEGAVLGHRTAGASALALARSSERAEVKRHGASRVVVIEWHPTTPVGRAVARALGGQS
jgi:hypothetical protein